MNVDVYTKVIEYVKSSNKYKNYNIVNINESKTTLLHNMLDIKVILDTKTFKVLENKSRKMTTVDKLLKGLK